MSRRRMLRLSVGAAAGLTMPGTPTAAVGQALPIPERLEGSVFNLDMRPGQREFLPRETGTASVSPEVVA